MLRWDNFKSNYQPMLCFCKFPTLLPIAIPKMFKIYIEKMTFQYNNLQNNNVHDVIMASC
jgi:hypothetical protein